MIGQININSIARKIKEFTESSAGKGKISEYIFDKRKSGNGKTASGGYIVTEQDMIRLAETMIRIMKEEISVFSDEIPKSVLDHFESLNYRIPKIDGVHGEYYIIEIFFEDDLSRPSFISVDGGRTGEGIKNIVSLFNTGYKSSAEVIGYWDGHEDLGRLASRTYLEGKYFIQRAVESFNQIYGKKYKVKAKITADEEFYKRR